MASCEIRALYSARLLEPITVEEFQQCQPAKRKDGQLTANGLLKPDTTLVIHAGNAYYEALLPLLENDPVSIEIPTEGLQIGDTLAWYNTHS